MQLTKQQFLQLIREEISERKLGPSLASLASPWASHEWVYDFENKRLNPSYGDSSKEGRACSVQWAIEYKGGQTEVFYVDIHNKRVNKRSCVDCHDAANILNPHMPISANIFGGDGTVAGFYNVESRIISALKMYGIQPNNVIRVRFSVQPMTNKECSTILNLPPDEPITQS
jgi:hypothetical protein